MRCFRFFPAWLVIVVGTMVWHCAQGAPGTAATVVPGHVEAWGRNLFGEAVPPPGLDAVIAVAGGSTHSLALRTDGTVVAWGSDDNGQSTVSVPAGLSNVTAIAAYGFSAALKADGTVVVWGTSNPQITNVPPAAVGLKAVEIVGSAVIALRADGTVVGWGSGNEANVPSGLTDVVQIAGVNGHALALTGSGTIVGWGSNTGGQASHPPGLTNVVRVAGGQSMSVALRGEGTLFRWGSPFAQPGEPPALTNLLDVQVGNAHGIALHGDGTVSTWGDNFAGQAEVPANLNGVTAIVAGGNHNLVITARPVINTVTAPGATTMGANVTLTVAASGEPLSYQWQHKGTNVPGATNASLTLRSIDPSRAGYYGVLVRNTQGYNFAETSVSLPPPIIEAEPESRTVFRGETVTLSVGVSGFPPFTYQWFRDEDPMPAETNGTVNVPATGREDSSVYRVTVTDVAGSSTTSSDATVRVFDPRPTSVALRPALDTSIYSSGINPLGTATILSGTRGNGIRDRGMLRFDVTSIPTNAVLDSASLRLRLVRGPGRGAAESTFHLHRALKPWGPEANWANASSTVAWEAAGGGENLDYATNGIAGTFMFGSGDLAFGATNEMFADIREWIQNPGTNHGWFLISDGEATVGTARHFGSSESENPPQLLIHYSIPAEVPTIRGMAVESTNFAFAIDGVAGWMYNIQARDHADRGIWTAFTNVAAGAGLLPIYIYVPMTNSHQFFRAFRF